MKCIVTTTEREAKQITSDDVFGIPMFGALAGRGFDEVRIPSDVWNTFFYNTSLTVRQRAWDWHFEVLMTRLYPGGCIVWEI